MISLHNAVLILLQISPRLVEALLSTTDSLLGIQRSISPHRCLNHLQRRGSRSSSKTAYATSKGEIRRTTPARRAWLLKTEQAVKKVAMERRRSQYNVAFPGCDQDEHSQLHRLRKFRHHEHGEK